jgi:hypothetical protein
MRQTVCRFCFCLEFGSTSPCVPIWRLPAPVRPNFFPRCESSVSRFSFFSLTQIRAQVVSVPPKPGLLCVFHPPPVLAQVFSEFSFLASLFLFPQQVLIPRCRLPFPTCGVGNGKVFTTISSPVFFCFSFGVGDLRFLPSFCHVACVHQYSVKYL